MVIDIPNQVMEQIRLTPTELKLELAVYLYEKKRLTLGQAKRLAGLGQIAFQKALASRDVYIHYEMSDFEKDLESLGIELKR
ncbi:MAG: UPF0175 family protein [Bacteroidetes bacterium]|nr:UPF0175 family protein [Bacteroidota bacterium]